MKITAISDMHGLQEYVHINECDILCICGDVVPLKMQRNIPQSLSWLKKQFIPWCEKQPCKQIYLVAGNHDFVFERTTKINDLFLGTKIVYLNNQSAEYLDENTGKLYTLWGSPLCHIFGNWAFMYNPEYEKEQFDKEVVKEKQPKLLLHGHLHSSNHECEMLGDTKVYNVSVVDERYEIKYKPLEIELWW